MITALHNRFLWRNIDSRTLIWFRAVFCGCLFLRLAMDATKHFQQIRNIPTFNPIPIFEILGIGRMSEGAFETLYFLLLICLLASLQGKWTRWFLSCSCFLSFILIGTLLSLTKPVGTNYVSHSQNIIIFYLFILAIMPGAGLASFRALFAKEAGQMPVWPQTLLLLSLGIVYFGSAYCKLVTAGVSWADGYTLQGYLFEHFILFGEPQMLWLAQNHTLCLFLSVGVLLIEFTFIFGCLIERFQLLYCLGGLSLHLGIYYFMNINFLQYHALAYLIFLRWEYVLKVVQSISDTRNHVTNALAAWAKR